MTYVPIQIEFDIRMRDNDGTSLDEIDNFDITIPFPSGNQEETFTGNSGIANITLRYEITCTEPDACTTTITSSDLIGTLYI